MGRGKKKTRGNHKFKTQPACQEEELTRPQHLALSGKREKHGREESNEKGPVLSKQRANIKNETGTTKRGGRGGGGTEGGNKRKQNLIPKEKKRGALVTQP